jgi:prepilin peptidase CpaA
MTLSLMISGLFYHAISQGAVGLGESALGLVTGIGILLVFFLMGGMGAGDVKLMGSAGAWLGLQKILYVFLASALIAGVYALVLMVICGRFHETWIHLRILGRRLMLVGKYLGADDRLETALKSSDRYRRVIPFAAMMAAGLVFLLLYSWLARGEEPAPSQKLQQPGSRPPPATSPLQTPALFPQKISSQELSGRGNTDQGPSP